MLPPYYPGYHKGSSPAAQTPASSPMKELYDKLLGMFGQGMGSWMSPDQMFAAQSAPIKRTFAEAREKMGSKIAALGAGNVRAIQSGEERLAAREGEALSSLRSTIGQQALARQLMGSQFLSSLTDMFKKAQLPFKMPYPGFGAGQLGAGMGWGGWNP